MSIWRDGLTVEQLNAPRIGGSMAWHLLRVGADGRVEFTERSHVPQRGEAQFDFYLRASRSVC